ncbi:MAG: DNA-processing protein DprA [Patescibacteria group bacterium]
MSRENIKTVKISSADYPKMLKEIADPPQAINFLGEIMAHEDKPKIAIVGTRKATRYGIEAALSLARELSSMGVIIVSGLAMGVDTAAHKGALEGGSPTWAVLGSGILNIQPTINRGLARKIIETGGAIISEYEHTHPADKWTFPQRNRIVAGLAKATIVVEAPEKSGALITADLAMQYNRDVGAVPGETTSINSRGTNLLIKNGAAIIRNAGDALELIGLDAESARLDNLDELENNILRHLSKPQSADELTELLNQNISAINQKLSTLEIKGAIKNNAGLFYKI